MHYVQFVLILLEFVMKCRKFGAPGFLIIRGSCVCRRRVGVGAYPIFSWRSGFTDRGNAAHVRKILVGENFCGLGLIFLLLARAARWCHQGVFLRRRGLRGLRSGLRGRLRGAWLLTRLRLGLLVSESARWD